MLPQAISLGSRALERVKGYLERGPSRRLLLSLAQGMARHHTGRTASAMAFNLFLATIPMLALAGWLLTVVLHGDSESLTAASTLLELTPAEVRQLFDRHFGRFSVHAVAPIAILGSLWLASSAFHTLMSVFAVRRGDADGAVSNAFGSNSFDILICLGLPVLVSGGIEVDWGQAWPMLTFLFGSTVLSVAFLITDWTLTRREAIVMGLAYALFVALAFGGVL